MKVGNIKTWQLELSKRGLNQKTCIKEIKESAMPPSNGSRGFLSLSTSSICHTMQSQRIIQVLSSALDKLMNFLSMLWSISQCFLLRPKLCAKPGEVLLPLGEACRHTPVDLLKGQSSSLLRASQCKSTAARLILVQKQWLPEEERVWEIGGRGFREVEEGGG